MKSIYVTIILLLLNIHFSFSQQKIIDSLELQLENPTNGKTKLYNLLKLGFYYQYSNPKKGLVRLKEAEELAMKNKDSFMLATVYYNKGSNNFRLGRDSIAFEFHDKAGKIYKVIDSIRAFTILSKNTAKLFSLRKKHKKALEKYQNIQDVFIEQKDTIHMALTYGAIGNEKMYLGNYTGSMESLLKGIKLLDEMNLQGTEDYAEIQVYMGLLYYKLGKYDDALMFHQKSLNTFKKSNMQDFMAHQYNNIGNIHFQKENFTEALKNYKAAYNIHKKNQNLNSMASAMNNIGIINSRLKKHSIAIAYYDSVIVINKKLKSYGSLAENYNNKAISLLKKNNAKEAEKYFDSSLVYAENAGDKLKIHEAKRGLSEATSLLGNYREAFKILEEAVIIKDELFSNDKKEELAVQKAQYEFDKEKAVIEATFKKDQEIQQANIEKQVFIRNLSIGAGIFVIGLLSIGFILWRKKREANYNAQLSSSQLQSLRAQMNPHFIFNTLNSINDYVLKNDKQKASNYLTQFSIMVRRILENTEEEEVSLAEEIEFLKSYVALEQKRSQHNFTFNVEVDQNINPEITLLPPSLLQPFIENSIWHGLSAVKQGHISLSFSRGKRNLVCMIEDNGTGFQSTESKNPLHKSFGLENVKNRLRLLNKSKKSNAKFEIKNQEEIGVKVIVTLPLILDE
ncbi:tetratricopeptide repeat protein [uncultured Kordia sp.]|uniref:tetratricopeptide repeat-containing sensor histidine kinase n=1 Tax=uncultured Kordia sp. TaxID=507699 RepID=UPI00260BB678|nr:tetratricopeptide repeat protein [uncultured Kordia sp.]